MRLPILFGEMSGRRAPAGEECDLSWRGRLTMKLLRRRERETGAAAVEFALVAPVMIALMFGIVEFGVAFNYKTTVNNYAAVTARSYSIDPATQPASPAERKALAATALGISPADVLTDPVASLDCTLTANRGQRFTVEIRVKRRTLTGFPRQEFTYSGKGLGLCA